jgi:3-hydroxyisobutyrate dehydrogenase-like beta-hydroxyacid dehydrogenase
LPIDYVDATVLGSSEQARQGDVIVMAGGRREAVESCADVLQTFARRWFHVGPCGCGARTKLVVNLVLGLNRAVLAEGLNFARRCGLDERALLEILRDGSAYSRVMDVKGEKMLRGDFTPQARLAQHLKDVGLILEQAARVGARTPLSEVHAELLRRVVELGGGDDDNSAVIRAYEAPESPMG